MNTPFSDPVFADLAELEKSLTEDRSGDRARAMVGYFDEMAKSSDALGAKGPAKDRRFATEMADGFRSCQKIIRHVWEKLHSAALPV